MFKDLPSSKDLHDSHSLHASILSLTLEQLMVFAKIRAQVVFPTPLGPQNKKAWARCSLLIAFFKVDVIESCPTTESNVVGLYFLAETI